MASAGKIGGTGNAGNGGNAGNAGNAGNSGKSIQVHERKGLKRSELTELRKQGKVPGAVFGKQMEPLSIAVDEKELMQLLRSHSHEVLELDVPEHGRQTVMLKEVQRDKVNSARVLHVDFHQINVNEPIRTLVRIEFTGDSQGVAAGGVMQTIVNELDVRALPAKLPAAIEIDVSALQIGDKLLAGDARMPEGVECLTPPEAVLATVLHVQKMSEEDERALEQQATQGQQSDEREQGQEQQRAQETGAD